MVGSTTEISVGRFAPIYIIWFKSDSRHGSTTLFKERNSPPTKLKEDI